MRLNKAFLIIFSVFLTDLSFSDCLDCGYVPTNVVVNGGSPITSVPPQTEAAQPVAAPPRQPIFQPVLPPILEEIVNFIIP